MRNVIQSWLSDPGSQPCTSSTGLFPARVKGCLWAPVAVLRLLDFSLQDLGFVKLLGLCLPAFSLIIGVLIRPKAIFVPYPFKSVSSVK